MIFNIYGSMSHQKHVPHASIVQPHGGNEAMQNIVHREKTVWTRYDIHKYTVKGRQDIDTKASERNEQIRVG